MPTGSIDEIEDDAPASAGTSDSGGTAKLSDITPDSFMEEQRGAKPRTAVLTPDSFMADQGSSAARAGTASIDDIVTPDNLPSREAFEASHQDAVKSWWQKAKDFGGAAAAMGEVALPAVFKKAQDLANTPLVPESVMPGPAKTPLGAAGRSALEFGRGLTSPENIGLAYFMGPLKEISPLLPRLLSGGFGVQMLKGAYDQIPEVKDAIAKKDWTRAAGAITTAALSGGLGVAAGAHALAGERLPPAAAEPTTASVADIEPTPAAARISITRLRAIEAGKSAPTEDEADRILQALQGPTPKQEKRQREKSAPAEVCA